MPKQESIPFLCEKFFQKDRLVLARMISHLEKRSEMGRKFWEGVFSRTGRAFRIGFTGPPGCGKSSLVGAIIPELRKQGLSIGIVAVDPTSVFSGGALLGDRVRMGQIGTDPEIFMRSMASRGSLGGLCEAAEETCDLLDAFGFDVILIETVGVGQLEMDIVESAHTVVVILSPESGDEVQAGKAGIMEIGDIFVINKADHKRAEKAAMEVEYMLHLSPSPEENPWNPPVLKTIATEPRGIPELVEKFFHHKEWLEKKGRLNYKSKSNLERKIQSALQERFSFLWTKESIFLEECKKEAESVFKGEKIFSLAVDALFERACQFLTKPFEKEEEGSK